MISYLAMDMATTLFVSSDCQMHCNQLTVKGTLPPADRALKLMGRDWKYFSSLAKIMNVWRSQYWKIFRTSHRWLGPNAALDHFKKLPQRCIAGRWRSILGAEMRLLDGKGVIPDVFNKTFTKDAGNAGSEQHDDTHADLHAEQQQ
jgi:hypothetical protein